MNTNCPTAKTGGLFGGAAFKSLNASLFWLICLMLADNTRDDYFDEEDDENLKATCSKNLESDKEAPTYGPWLLVSYGKQGNKFYKGRFGRNGNGNSGNTSGSGTDGLGYAGRNTSGVSGNGISGSGTSGRTGSGNGGRNGSGYSGNGVSGSGNDGSIGKHPVTEGVIAPKPGKATGSRFDILSEEGDVIMGEGNSQNKNKSEEGRKSKGKVVLSERWFVRELVLLISLPVRTRTVCVSPMFLSQS
ncbi:hypothetical protein Q3G72_004885 [Acer saccharum]|nr:hypothetical protein Q3G72_004885 [Acer saccharum]